MTSAITNNRSPRSSSGLSREKMQQLLAAIGSRPAKDTAQVEATEYDWHQPHHFSSDQLKKLECFTEKVAAAIAKKFATLYNSDFDVTIASTTQHFAYEFLDQVSAGEQSGYYLAFGIGQQQGSQSARSQMKGEKPFGDINPCGLISIPLQTAISWVTQLLGEKESEKEPDKALSQLEESLLSDIGFGIVEAFSNSYEGCDFYPAGGIIREKLPLELRGPEELCKITFSTKKAETENSAEADLLILCDKLDPVVGKSVQADSKLSANDISKAILKHLSQMSVSVTAQLASTALTFEQIMSLRPCDVLLLDKRINEAVELIVEGRTLFRGQPAKSTGKYAVVITESPFCGPGWSKSQNINPE